MHLTTAEAAAQLGVSARQVRRSAVSGQLTAGRHGRAFTLSALEVRALGRTETRGRPWSDTTRTAALDLLSVGTTDGLRGSQLSRLKRRIRESDAKDLAGHLLRGRVTLRRAPNAEVRSRYSPKIAGELGLGAFGGLAVVVSEDGERLARSQRMVLDADGDVAFVDGLSRHTAVLEVLALFTLGNAREHAAARDWLHDRPRRV
ncbi:MAG: hypothetical protein QG597_535 [Actinomycetota bacterium]|nr:hypothetical protein [Actinomycetota bacterium]